MTEKKIETLGSWGAVACLHPALEEIEHGDGLIVLRMRDERVKWWTANIKTSDAVFMAECVRHKMMDEL